MKKSKLASIAAMDYSGSLPSLAGRRLHSEEGKKAISELIRLIGQRSSGGDGVEDIRRERER
ncbi:MAG: hypothetical protein ACE5KJ_04730 [Candidatus Zixiibacteriota bacterium]